MHCRGSRLFINTKLFSDQFAETVFNFCMAGNRGFSSVSWIHIDVMIRTVTLQVASSVNKFTDEEVSLQASTPISFA